MFLPAQLIKKKRDGAAYSAEELRWLIKEYTAGQIPDYQMAAWLMAVFFKSLNADETSVLTEAMLHSGAVLDFSDIPNFKVDKHSTGGVGDKTSLILGPIVASFGISVPMIAGRGLGHTGGTLDKLESIPGFSTQIELDQFTKMVREQKLSFLGQTLNICPADKKLYALRDVTSTVDCFPLICASIMSKKLAEGVDGLVFDVKFGDGAFMKTKEACENLANGLVDIADRHGKKVCALLTSMDQPMGRYAGNSLEVFECLEVMRGKEYKNAQGRDLYEDTRTLSVELAAQMLLQSGRWKNLDECKKAAQDTLKNGQALKKFEEVCKLQFGSLEKLPMPTQSLQIQSPQAGFVSGFYVEELGFLGVKIGAGRSKTSDVIEPSTGIEFHVKIGDKVEPGTPVLSLHGSDLQKLKLFKEAASQCIKYSLQRPSSPDLIWKCIQRN